MLKSFLFAAQRVLINREDFQKAIGPNLELDKKETYESSCKVAERSRDSRSQSRGVLDTGILSWMHPGRYCIRGYGTEVVLECMAWAQDLGHQSLSQIKS
ncbi:hypothetical protein DM860_005675 [Cuscuta australis]|uniref:Uncharacterized protein n=1 Tax=Cuscuta australis TaxID=267555 RepID=A0A328DVQ6_9ASTE|nr:hypothetical protein DM860_005675 [Cuscuta australis]